MNRMHRMQFGAQRVEHDHTRFRLWAPTARRVELNIASSRGESQLTDMKSVGSGWYEVKAPGVETGSRYRFRIDEQIEVPDPASRFNPDGVHGESVLIDPTSFEWRDQDWRGHDWRALSLYELHVGAFTPEGTYAAMLPRLDDLAKLGITAIELLPLATFAGTRGWGYDGVLPFAPHPTYGTPEDLKNFVQCAHERNLSVVLDVVYNHFGPEGNYLGSYARDFFTTKHCTPWGDAIDFSNTTVRQYFIQNALYWVNEYHFDGLRIDAVHAMVDEGPKHFIDELIDTVQDGPGQQRHVHIILENHHNESRRLKRSGVSQWNDDFHHPLHIVLTGERDGYYADYADDPIHHLGRALAEGFAYQGERSKCSGKERGEPSAHLSPAAFVNFLQNHDQIGNRALGERIEHLSDLAPLRAAFAILLLGPQLPMLFMGEEYAASQPFFYFCDFSGDLATAVRDGRRNEFADFGAFSNEAVRETIPDPNAPETFIRSRLVWEDRQRPPHSQWRQYVADLLRIRSERIVPLIAAMSAGQSSYQVEGGVLNVHWPTSTGTALRLIANLSAAPAQASDVPSDDELTFSTSSEHSAATLRVDTLAPWEVRVFVHQRIAA